ncbi:retinol dehydrogenase 12-like [Amyelois transitella]|uniref:retinol dehydrogenase 12-like n=1 Tax=Amyelois transitella TaxID=680683 RepID=UPI00298FD30D|nr:retinol dehydrogenase 12-like [Amyelois transitella]
MFVNICCVLSFLSKILLYVALTATIIVIVLKLWLEPTKGVCRCKTKLKGKVALVTGGNSGIGLETARDLARRGARVIIASSNDEKSKLAVKDIIATTGNINVEYRHLDLSKFRSVTKFAEDFKKTVNRLDVLVNNAGFAGAETITEDGMNVVMQINYLGPFLLTSLLIDKLIESRPSRIVIVTSCAHQVSYFDPEDLPGLKDLFCSVKIKGYDVIFKDNATMWFRYANSKLCDVLWTKALSKRLPSGVTVNCLHPGVVYTNIFNNVHPVIRIPVLAMIKYAFFKNAEEGAQTTIHLCVSSDVENVSGEYFSDCKVSQMSRKASDNNLVDKVWNDTIKLIQKTTNCDPRLLSRLKSSK